MRERDREREVERKREREKERERERERESESYAFEFVGVCVKNPCVNAVRVFARKLEYLAGPDLAGLAGSECWAILLGSLALALVLSCSY